MKKIKLAYCLLLGVCLALAGCGGGGSGKRPTQITPPDQGSSDWDELVWDQDDWA